MLLVRTTTAAFLRTGFAGARGILVALLASLHMLLVRTAAAAFLRTGFVRARGILVALLASLDVLFVRSTLTVWHNLISFLVESGSTGVMTLCSCSATHK